MAIYFFHDFLVFLFGLACLVVASRWPAQSGKKTFVAFVVIAVLLAPMVRMFSWPLFWMTAGMVQRPRNWMFGIGPWLTSLLSIVGALLLLVYSIFRNDHSGKFAPGHADKRFRSFHPTEPPDWRILDAGPIWDVNVSNHARVSIARRREWAFLIDFSPIFIWMIVFAIFGSAVQWGLKIPAWLNGVTVTLVSISIPVTVAYWVFKDSSGGVSIGKRITGCRVVCQDSGKPIDAGKSVLRNLVFLLPIGPLVELAVASLRNDRRRIGDLIAGTVVVMGPPKWIDGAEVEVASAAESAAIAVPHPLDD